MKISARNVFKGKIIEVTKGATTAHVLLRQAWRTTSYHFGASWARTDGRGDNYIYSRCRSVERCKSSATAGSLLFAKVSAWCLRRPSVSCQPWF
jgi:hypothetical protein